MRCKTVSPGWYCAGENGHDGPCAAWPPCHFCGYLGPGLRPLGGMSSICGACNRYIIPGDTHGARGDQVWDGSLWWRIKDWFRKRS